MNMNGLKCEICNLNDAIGIASTRIPYSAAYCVECAKRNAQPEFVFDVFLEQYLHEDGRMDKFVTFKEGKYITFKEWKQWKNI